MTRLISIVACAIALAGCRESKSPPAKSPAVTGAAAKDPGKDPAKDPGTDPSKDPGKDPGQAPLAAATPDAAPAAPQRPEPKEREDGPKRATCETLADHLGGFVTDSMLPANATAEQRAYVEKLVKDDRPNVVRFCLESATPEEADCAIKAADFPTLAACERFRRQVPKDLAKRDEVTPEDCEKVFLRLKQFKIDEGVSADEVDKTKDQIIRACEEKAKPGTVACFISSRTYEEARRCP